MTEFMVEYAIGHDEASSQPIAAVLAKDQMLQEWKPSSWRLKAVTLDEDSYLVVFIIEAGCWEG